MDSTSTKEIKSLFMDHGWAGFPKHLLDSVLDKLECSMDYLQFGCVCFSWHSVLKDNQVTLNKKLRHHQAPMLLVPNINDISDKHVWRIYNVMENKFLDSTLSIPYDKRFCGSSQGWLVFVHNDWSVSLYKPFSNEDSNIRLPCLFPPDLEVYNISVTQIYDYHIHKVFITADPQTNPNECTVFVIFDEYYNVAFIKLAENTKWTLLVDVDEDFYGEDLMQFENKIYCVTNIGNLHVFNVTDSNNPNVAWVVTDYFTGPGSIKRYIVELDGNLLQVERHFVFQDHETEDGRRETVKFRISQLDWSTNQWNEIEGLGDYSLFLGVNSSISVQASNVTGCQRNCIYFTHDVDDLYGETAIICDLGIYDIQSKEFKFHYTIDSSALDMMTRRPPIWIVPTFDMY